MSGFDDQEHLPLPSQRFTLSAMAELVGLEVEEVGVVQEEEGVDLEEVQEEVGVVVDLVEGAGVEDPAFLPDMAINKLPKFFVVLHLYHLWNECQPLHAFVIIECLFFYLLKCFFFFFLTQVFLPRLVSVLLVDLSLLHKFTCTGFIQLSWIEFTL